MPTAIETLRWVGDERGHLVLIDQTRLPMELVELECRDVETVWEAIKQLRVRGAPAIGIAAAYGVVLVSGPRSVTASIVLQAIGRGDNKSGESRPTAVNCFGRRIG
jgi:methylthioribose-1-phosphate isomerase